MSRVRSTIDWVRGLDPVRADVLLAVAFLVSFEVQASLVAAHPGVRFAQALTGLAIAVAIVIRRRWMVQALLLACVVFVGKRVLIGDQAACHGGVGGLLGMLLLFYGCGAFLDGRRAWFGPSSRGRPSSPASASLWHGDCAPAAPREAKQG